MKLFLLIFFIVCCSPLSIMSMQTEIDSLTSLFAQAKTQSERMERCLNVDNYYRNILFKDSVTYTYILLAEGIKSHNEYAITDALRKLVMGVNRKERTLANDSIKHYLAMAEKNLTGERKRCFITEVNLRHIRSIADWTKDEKKTIEELTSKYANTKESSDDIYFQIERYYALGMAAALSISETETGSYKNASRYFDRLFYLIQEVPIEYGAELLFWVNENIYTTYLNGKEYEKTIKFLEQMMDILKRYKELPEVKKDVYQTFEYVYSLYYQGMAHFPNLIGYEKAFDCLTKSVRMLRKRNNILSVYFAYKAFYKSINDHKKSILYGDSIVFFYKKSDYPVAKAVCANIYKEQAESYFLLHEYKSAYEMIQKYEIVQKKIINDETKKMRAEMDARYDLNHLELEKERLVSRNRKIAIFFILFVFILSVAWGISQRYHLNKLKWIQKKLMESNAEVIKQSEKAQESEKMKTAFINSMCHEIRTPLNAINGFSNLLLDESIDAECKEDFPDLIQKNTNLLTRLLNDMLEVSSLSSSAEELPTENVDIYAICSQEMDKLKAFEKKESICYSLELKEGQCEIYTNTTYLSQTIMHLLNNANKFTEEGKITLSCSQIVDGYIEIRVSDTGIGIPLDKQEWVFERFTKIDDFKPGVGLGLHICRLIINRLGGTISIDNEYIGGTSFIISLPIHAAI